MSDRATIFIDGNNWYHSICNAGVKDRGRLDYRAISMKVVGPRMWVETRYYIGRVSQTGNAQLYADQRKFVASLTASDPRISVHFGRLEPRTHENEAAIELQRYLSNLPIRIDADLYRGLSDIAQRHRKTQVMVEKAVDVRLAVDLVVMAERNEFDAAYLLSADGDFTPAVEAVRAHGRKVYIVTPGSGAQLAKVASSFIPLKGEWFDDCYRA
jgi:Uncharacterized conserved protein